MTRRARLSKWATDSPGLAGALLLALAAVVRAAASATPERVYVFRRELSWGCLMRQAFGFPCPACGLTRGVLLALGGRLGESFAANPAAPLLVLGVALAALALMMLSLYRRGTRDPLRAGFFVRRLRLGARAYALLLFAVLFAHWAAEIFRL
jgi:Protein of unknown function (DUF2752)